VKKLVIWSLVIAGLVLLCSTQAKAWNTHEAYHCYHTCQIPTATPSPTDTPKDCEGGDTYSIRQECPPSVTPTEEATPSATPTEQPHQDVSDGRSSSPDDTTAHSPACTIDFAAPLLQGFVFHKDTGIQSYSWWASTEPGITKQSVEYGYEIGNPLYGADNLNPNQTSIDIFGLDPLRISWLRVVAWKGQCPAYSNWFN
jgi:hypothetical protein